MKKAHGFAFFPDVGRGGFIVAGSHGNGVVYEQGQHVGFAELTGGSIGFTIGGQASSELIVFENKAAMDRFKKGNKLRRERQRDHATSGAGASASFVDGVAVFVRPLAGRWPRRRSGGSRSGSFRSDFRTRPTNESSVETPPRSRLSPPSIGCGQLGIVGDSEWSAEHSLQ